LKQNIGLIDFGSNTFHLLIATITKDEMKIIYRKRSYVFLAQGGIHHILPEAMKRAFKTVELFYKKCKKYNARPIISVGTSALRTADNRSVFLNKIKSQYQIEPEIIDGKREAELIYKGMALACPDYHSNALMMDIGGGSTEFTLTHQNKVVFQTSLIMGLGELSTKFPLTDPITTEESKIIYSYLNHIGKNLIEAIQSFLPDHLIGGSGTFDVLARVLTHPQFKNPPITCTKANPIDFQNHIDSIIHSKLQERMQNPNIPSERVQLIVHACLSIKWILKIHSFQKIVFSKYALKEGLLKEYYDRWFHRNFS